MSILVPRTHTLGVRLSVDEYTALEEFCVESGSRSISDLARAAICSFVRRADQENVLASTLHQNVAQVKDLEQRIEALTAEIRLLQSSTIESAAKCIDEADRIETEMLPDSPTYDPGL